MLGIRDSRYWSSSAIPNLDGGNTSILPLSIATGTMTNSLSNTTVVELLDWHGCAFLEANVEDIGTIITTTRQGVAMLYSLDGYQ